VLEVPGSRLVEVDAGRYAIGMNPETARAVADFLRN
jgi:hypothetical protein